MDNNNSGPTRSIFSPPINTPVPDPSGPPEASDNSKTPRLKHKGWLTFGALAVIAIVIGVVATVMYLHNQALKQDRATYDKAQVVAQKLNSYVSLHGSLPPSLAAAGSSATSAGITYQKSSDTSYAFCVTYKTSLGNTAQIQIPSTVSTLYINPDHKKGTNCETVDAFVYINSFKTSGFNPLAATCQYNPDFGDQASTVYEQCLEDFYSGNGIHQRPPVGVVPPQ